MMKNITSLQDLFLNAARRDRIPVTIFLINGFQIKGVVRGFDSFTVVADSDGKQQLIYKSAISTICPAKPVNLAEEAENAEAADI
ncbi:MAG: RNA chaperone Hfq [Oscillospiraceae bacterium]|nr:RNA chaperone Hfq [Oscillospiraceae bacterium]